MSSLFKSPQARARLVDWYERFYARIPTPPERRVVRTGYGETHVLVGGPEGAPAVVLLHGAMASSAHLLVELAPLLERFRVYAVDVLGQSVMSADARPSVSNDDYGRWLAEVMDALSLPRAHVVAVSWGGFVAVRLAAFAPERIERLVLLVPAGLVSGSAWEGFTRMGWPLTRYLMSPGPGTLRRLMASLLTTTDDEAWTGYLGDAFLAYRLGDMKVPVLARPEELARFAAPTLVVAADRDVSFPGPRLLARAAQLFPGLQDTELLRDCNHSPPTTPAFREWLSGRIAAFLGGTAR